MHVQLCIRKIFFCLVAPLTQRSDSKAIHKSSKFITGISFYYIQQVINPQRQWGYIINTKVFITQQITSNEMNFNSTNPRPWKRLLWTRSDLWEGPATVNLETNAGLIIQAEAAYVRTHNGMVGKHTLQKKTHPWHFGPNKKKFVILMTLLWR